MIKTFCLAHKPILYKLPIGATVIWPRAEPFPQMGEYDVLRVADVYDDLDALDAFLGGAGGLFAIRRLIAENKIKFNAGDLISICQYRRFVVPVKLGTNGPGTRLIAPLEAKNLDVESLHGVPTHHYLLAQPVSIAHLLQQYSDCHHAPDILRYTAIALEVGAITKAELLEFLSTRSLVPGGFELGIFPVGVFCEIVERLEEVALAFLRQHQPVCLTPYQRKAIAFCTERLGNYLLMKKLIVEHGKRPSRKIFGWMHTIVDNGVYTIGSRD